MRIAMVGAGSMGTIIGALLSKAGEDIVLVDVDDEHVCALNDTGACITGHMELIVPVRAITPGEMEGIYDLVIYMVKTTHDEKALPQMLPHIDESSTVLTLQNGIPEENVASVVGRDRTVGGAVGWGATLIGPGRSELTSEPDAMEYQIGELDGSETPRINAVKELLNKAGNANVTSNLTGIRWSKLLINASFSGMSTALGCTFGEFLDDDKATQAAASICVETIKTAHALGVKMESMSGPDPSLLLDIVEHGDEVVLNVLRMIGAKHRNLKASMLQDLEKGRPCEVETLNGYLSRRSAEAGIPTPVNHKVTEIIRGIQDGKYPLSFENLDMIEVRPILEIL